MNDAAARAEVTVALRLIRALTAQADRYVDGVRGRLGMPRTDVTAMGVIADSARDQRALTPGSLAQELHLSASTVTALLDRLERVGHVQRGRDALDRRKVVIEITPSALQVSADAFRPLSDAIRASLAEHSDADLQTFSRVLAELVKTISSVAEETRG